MVSQTEFTLRPRTRGFHLITDEVVRAPLSNADIGTQCCGAVFISGNCDLCAE